MKFQDTLYACKRTFIRSFAIYMIVGLIYEKKLLKCMVTNYSKFDMDNNN